MIPNLWMILPEAGIVLDKAYGQVHTVLATPEVREKAQAFSLAKAEARTNDLKVVKGEAQIRIAGPLLDKADWILDYFGIEYGTYAEIRAAIAQAQNGPDVTSLRLDIDSPGGMVAGLFDLLADLKAFSKPKRTTATLAASAAYAIAAHGGPIEASDKVSTFGSVGVVATYFIRSYSVDVTSTAAPDKRPDPGTEQGRAVIRAYLDEIHDLFATDIGSGRGISSAAVNANYGGGRVFTAGPSLERGLIDSIAGQSGEKNKASKAAKGKQMDINTLKAEHPALYAQVFAAGEAAGEERERKRVTSHLKLGEACGNVTVAFGPIRDGSSPADALADYQSAHMTRTVQTERQQDDEPAARALSGRKPETAASAKEQAFIKAFKEEMGDADVS